MERNALFSTEQEYALTGMNMLYFWLFAEGFIALTYQLLFFRQLTPSVGSSSVVDAWIIGSFLGAMGLGYLAGGKTSSAPMLQFGKNLLYTAFIAGIGASSLFITGYFQAMSDIMPLLYALILYSILIIAPVAYFMGQSLPLLLQQSKWGETTAEKGGNALSLSTYGSMAGAIIPVTFLTPILGASGTLALNIMFATILGTYLLFTENKGARHLPILAVFGFVFTLSPYFSMQDGKFTSTQYSDILLLEDESERYMYANGLIMSSQYKNGINSADYLKVFQHSLTQQKVAEQDILVLGAGGFMAHTEDLGNNRYTYVDIDSDLIGWAEKHFNFKEDGVNIVVDDARHFMLKQNDDQWPVIYLDTYGSRFSIPEHLVTREFFALAHDKLSKNGLLMFNIIMDPQFDSVYSRRIHATVQSVFPFCHIVQVTPDQNIANLHYTCFANKNPEGIYVDDKHNISHDVWKQMQ